MTLKTLEDVLSEICKDMRKRGVPLCSRIFKLIIWIDSVNCRPVIGKMDINFNNSVSHPRILGLFRKINSYTPISMIMIDGKNYHITKTEEFMKKPCRCS